MFVLACQPAVLFRMRVRGVRCALVHLAPQFVENALVMFGNKGVQYTISREMVTYAFRLSQADKYTSKVAHVLTLCRLMSV